MKGNEFEQLFAIAKRKNRVDQTSSWSQGSETYFKEIFSELDEVKAELESGNTSLLEEELGDVLWDYLNLLIHLDSEQKISINRVLLRCIEKFDERVTGIEQGESWQAIKARQKARHKQP
jgi:NTP pyrophosphatase (non-canonical NTP hydrolase)